MDWAGISVRFGLYLDLTLLFGLPLFSLHAFRRDEPSSAHVSRAASRVLSHYAAVTAAAAAIGIVLSLAGIVVMARSMTGVAEYSALRRDVFTMIVTGTDAGMSWAVRMVALALCLMAGLSGRTHSRLRSIWQTTTAAVALATLAWSGHGAMDDDGLRRYLHLAADIGHLLAAGVWVGALVAFVLLAWTKPSASRGGVALLSRAADGFAKAGTVVVVTLMLTGTLNYWLIVGPELPAVSWSSYGGQLLAKLALFGAMLGLAAANRYRLSPRLARAVLTGDYAQAVSAFRTSLMIETTLAILILALVASLGVLSPKAA